MCYPQTKRLRRKGYIMSNFTIAVVAMATMVVVFTWGFPEASQVVLTTKQLVALSVTTIAGLTAGYHVVRGVENANK